MFIHIFINSSHANYTFFKKILLKPYYWLQRHQCPLLNTIPQAVWKRVILLQFLLTVLTFCAWLMFLLVSYWLWSDAAITEVTEVHYVNHTVQLPDSTAPSVSQKIIMRPSPPFLSYCTLEQKWTYSFQNFKKMFRKKKLLCPNSTSSPFYHCLNLFHFIFKHSHDPIAQVPDYMHVSVCAVLGGLGFKGGLMEMVGRAVGEITELCCSNWVKQVIQQCCFKSVTYHLSYVAESYFWQACNSN